MNFQMCRNHGLLEAQFDAPEWSQGEKVIKHLKKRFNAEVMEKAEGPDARTWTVRIEGGVFVVNQWDTGDISLFAKDSSLETMTNRIAESIQKEVP